MCFRLMIYAEVKQSVSRKRTLGNSRKILRVFAENRHKTIAFGVGQGGISGCWDGLR